MLVFSKSSIGKTEVEQGGVLLYLPAQSPPFHQFPIIRTGSDCGGYGELVSFQNCSLLMGAIMPRWLAHIIRFSITGFLLVALSGFTVVVHHEHSIGDASANREHDPTDGLVVKTKPQTYHEVHIVKLLSGDSFSGSQTIDLNTSVVKFFELHLDSPHFPPYPHSTSLTHTEIRETGPPSVDRCILFCSFLI